MLLTFPHMGTLHIVLQTLFTSLGRPVQSPASDNQKALELGTAYAPETACLPFKISQKHWLCG